MNRDTTTTGSLLAALAASTISSFAAAGVHDNSWTNTGTGDWFEISNWSMDAIPAFDHRTDISNGGSAILASLSAQCHALTLGDSFGGSGTLSIESGGQLETNTFSTIAEQGESSGTVNVTGSGSEWTIGDELNIGLTGAGILNIQDGGTVTSDDHANIGAGNGGDGTVTVAGAGSTWNLELDLRVGQHATGDLTIEDGGVVNTRIGVIGDGIDGHGTALITSPGSIWTSSEQFFLGVQGNGELTVAEQGEVESAGAFTIARDPDTNGTLNIGNGGPAGFVDAASISGGDGNATLNFNHDERDYSLTTDGTSAGDAVIIEGSTAVNHIGSGTTTLQGVHSYSGTTTIESGTLLMDGAFVFNSTLTVNAGGTLGGTGVVGPVLVDGGTLAPGLSAGSIQVADLTLNSDSALEFELAGLGEQHDAIDVPGDVTLDGTLHISDLGGLEEGTYTLITYLGRLTDNGLSLGSLPSGFAASIDTAPLGEVRVIIEVEDVACIGDVVSSATFEPPPDGQVDGADLAYLLGAWGVNPGSLADLVTSATFEPPPDGVVDGADLAYLLGAWGACE